MLASRRWRLADVRRNYQGWSNSPLKQVTAANVKRPAAAMVLGDE
jgi:hypothetical protein